MKKSLLVVGLMFTMLFPVFAEYTLKADDQKAVDAVIQKIQTKPIRTQEVVIKALKNAQNKTNFTAQKKAIFSAIESGLRQKTSSGDMLATSLERKEIIQSLFTQTNQGEKGSTTIEVAGNVSSSQDGDFSFKGSLAADVDVQDKKNPKVRLQMDVFAKDKDMTLDTVGEMRVLDSVGYFLIKKLDITPDDEQIKEFVTPYLNMWWKVPFDMGSVESIQTSAQPSFDIKNGQQALLNKNVIPKLFYKGQKQGVSVYGGTVNNGALVDMAYDIAVAQGETLNASDKADMYTALKGVTLQTEFSLDTKKTFSAITITTTFKDALIDTDTINGVITTTINMSSQVGSIIAPENARDINEVFPTDGY